MYIVENEVYGKDITVSHEAIMWSLSGMQRCFWLKMINTINAQGSRYDGTRIWVKLNM